MYAIAEIQGYQYKLEKDQILFVNQLEGNEGDTFEIDKVLLTDKDGKVAVGAPVVKGAKIKANILGHVKGDKVMIFKKNRRKGYKVKRGHRQSMTKIQIVEIK
jgi:large subunit ribosomal protein L21